MEKEFNNLIKEGYQFDPELETFYVPHELIDQFKAPDGFEKWNVSPLIVDSYLTERLTELGITDAENNVTLYGGVGLDPNEKTDNKIFHNNRYGDIEILLYSLKRQPFIYADKGAENTSANNREKYAVLTRYAPHRAKIKGRKYDFDKSKTGNHLFWHPELIDLYENQTEVETLVLTEGFFKAFKGTKEGIPTVGLPSISIYTEKKGADELHPEILDFIDTCSVKNVVILWDADAREISRKALQAKEDLFTRPGNFVKYANNIQEKLRARYNSKRLNITFARIKDSNEADNKSAKGLDDLLLAFPDRTEEIKNEILERKGATYYFRLIDFNHSTDVKNIYKDFKLHSFERFYEFHQHLIKGNDFEFRGNTYQIEDGKPNVKISANIKRYKRIGGDYYKVIEAPEPSGQGKDPVKVERLVPWPKSAIIDDHGKDVIKHVERFDGFTNIPSHTNYQRRINGFWNLYGEVNHKLEPGEWSTIETLMRHIFAEQYEYGLDYIQISYQIPIIKLPIVCLVSREQETGKSTFVYLLKLIFKANMTTVTNNDLNSDFNSAWVDKKIIVNEETSLEKSSTYNSLKYWSTAKNLLRNEKNRSAGEIPFFGQFVFCSNDEDTFLKLSEDDKRFWVRKIPSIPEESKTPNFDQKLEDELPHFLHYLSTRELHVKESKTRMYLDTRDLRTEAFNKVVRASIPSIEKEIRGKLEHIFITYGINELMLTADDLINYYGVRRVETAYIERILENNMDVDKVRNKEGKTKVVRYNIPYVDTSGNEHELKIKKSSGRPYILPRDKFVTDDVELDPELTMEAANVLYNFNKDAATLADEILTQ
jgi:hypothetical protein